MNSSGKLINLNSRQLQAFLEVSRLHSFAKAAEQVHLSPSGMSMLIKEIEDQIGARLFERTTRSVTLTDSGRRLQPVAERIVGELRALDTVIGGTEAAVRSRIYVAATPMMSATLLPEVVRAFGETHPNVRVHLADVDVGTVRRRVLDGEADIGLGFFVRPAVGLLRQSLCQFRLMLVSPPGLAPAGTRRSLPWSRVAELPLVSLPADNPIQVSIEKQMPPGAAAHREHPRVNLIGTLLGMVRAGHGHAVLPAFALEECLRQNLGVSVLREPAAHIDLFMVSRRGGPVKPAALEFAAALKRAAAPAAYL